MSPPESVEVKPQKLGLDDAWLLLRRLVAQLRKEGASGDAFSLSLSTEGKVKFGQAAIDSLSPRKTSRINLIVDDAASAKYHSTNPITDDARQLLDLFLPLCHTPSNSSLVVAHLAQSLDGRIATNAGASKFISAQEDLCHTHRLRAFFDAVVVGVNTALHDDPLLTTRLVPGPHPTRVIIDPKGSILPTCQLMSKSDSPTLIITSAPVPASPREHVEFVRLPAGPGGIEPHEIIKELEKRKLRRIFIEGGGITISHFLQAQLIDRLHVAIAPTILGSGKPSFQLSPIVELAHRLRLEWRSFQFGPDILLDCIPCPPTAPV